MNEGKGREEGLKCMGESLEGMLEEGKEREGRL